MHKKVMVCFGTRPEAIKMCPLVHSLRKNNIDTIVCLTGQHREMLKQVLDFFNIKPDINMDVMTEDQSLSELSSQILLKTSEAIYRHAPRLVFVHGDTSTSFFTALAAFYQKIEVAHVEAGLRTNNKYSPFPEEMNRQLTSKIATYHFSPTQLAETNLLNEGIRKENIIITGNTVIDALIWSRKKIEDGYVNDEILKLKSTLDPNKRLILLTTHRRENMGNGVKNICQSIQKILTHFHDVEVVIPVHPNPKIKNIIFSCLRNTPRTYLINPASYPTFIWLMMKSNIILTDSGGIQEEAPYLKTPTLVLREFTEREEAIQSGYVKLLGTEVEKIFNETSKILTSKSSFYGELTSVENIYGNGTSCEQIAKFINNIIV